MRPHRILFAAAGLLAGASLAQTSRAGTEKVNPQGWSTGSTTVPPGKSGLHAPSDVTPEGPQFPPPVSSALGTTPAPEMVLAELHTANAAQIELGTLAEHRARSEAVRSFARHMVQAHTGLDRAAQGWARKNHLTIPPLPETPERQEAVARREATRRRLRSLSGADFDRAYLQVMVDDHARVLSEVQTLEEQVTDGSLQELLHHARLELAAHGKTADGLLRKLGSA